MLVPALFPILEELRPGFFRLAHENDVGELSEIIFLNADPGAADDGEGAALFQLRQDLSHPQPLHAHAREADDIRLSQPIKIERLDVLVDESYLMFPRSQCGQQGQGCHRQVGPLS